MKYGSLEVLDPPRLTPTSSHQDLRRDASTFQPLVEPLGSCIASNRITVDGLPVGYMYREEPHNDLDSGWRFFAGDESDDDIGSPANFELYSVNTLANYDPRIVPFLNALFGTSFETNGPNVTPVSVVPR